VTTGPFSCRMKKGRSRASSSPLNLHLRVRAGKSLAAWYDKHGALEVQLNLVVSAVYKDTRLWHATLDPVIL
jgi:hypothetical protein